jgi:hypothetical protein
VSLKEAETETVRRFLSGGFHDAADVRIAIQEMRNAYDERPDPDVRKAIAEEEDRKRAVVRTKGSQGSTD